MSGPASTLAPRRPAWPVLPLAWTLIIAWLTLTPIDGLPPMPHWELLSFDTAAHAGVFLVLAVLAVFSARRQQRFPRLRRRAFWWVLVAGTLYGALIELLQTHMALGRMGEWSDVISDTLGTVVGLLLMRLTQRYWL
ncbi:VanZ family protein [Hymenobacter sp. B81]|uniref:VanZ family protein n=1 Tax=Hymenobacter sp. B81 TaxID=3344878 RepID=UPI0037DDBFEC